MDSISIIHVILGVSEHLKTDAEKTAVRAEVHVLKVYKETQYCTSTEG